VVTIHSDKQLHGSVFQAGDYAQAQQGKPIAAIRVIPFSRKPIDELVASCVADAQLGQQVGVLLERERPEPALVKARRVECETQDEWNKLVDELDGLLLGSVKKPKTTCGDGFCHLWAALGAVGCLDGLGTTSISQRDFGFRMQKMLREMRNMARDPNLSDELCKRIGTLEKPQYRGCILPGDLHHDNVGSRMTFRKSGT